MRTIKTFCNSRHLLFNYCLFNYQHCILRLILLTAISFLLQTNYSISQNETDTLVDSRDGKSYKTVKIGKQWWMAENLNYGKKVNGNPIGIFQTNNSEVEKYCYSDNEANCTIYGGLYDWNEAMNYTSLENGHTNEDIQGICPCQWHLPSDEEWFELEKYLGMPDESLNQYDSGRDGTTQADSIKSAGTTYWKEGNNGINSAGFNAIAAGNRHNYNFMFGNLGVSTGFWTSSKDQTNYIFRGLQYNYSQIARHSGTNDVESMVTSYSVRCVKNKSTASVNTLDESNIRLYPNPSTGIVNLINLPNNTEIVLYNSLGEALQTLTNQIDSSFKIDISDLPPGVYYLKFAKILKMFVKI